MLKYLFSEYKLVIKIVVRLNLKEDQTAIFSDRIEDKLTKNVS